VSPLRFPTVALALLLAAEGRCAAPPASSADALARLVDARLAASLKAVRVSPAPAAGDAEFLRRATLDLAGRIPRVDEVRAFLADRRPDRRDRLVARLLASPGHANHLAQVWRAYLAPQASTNLQTQHLGVSLEAWLRPRFRAGRPYDALVRELLTAPLDYLDRRADGPSALSEGPSAVAFYQAGDLKAETVAANASRLFLGVRLECAQCHDHPFDRWTRKQFWQTAAFFAAVPPLEPGGKSTTARLDRRRTLTMPEKGGTIGARFLDGKEPDWARQPDPRAAFATWLTARDNPFFARVAVNRVWAQLFGVGLVDPIDDFGEHNPASHPDLLDDLARAFAASDFDLAFLYRALTRTDAYRRTSRLTLPAQNEPRLFARMNVKALSPEQLFDSLALATGYRERIPPAARPAFGIERGSARGLILGRFGGGQSRTDTQTSILQALAVLNGDWLARQTDPRQGATLKAVLSAPFLDDSSRIEALFLATLSRPPRPEEQARLLAHLRRGRRPGEALGDVFWALLNSHEFLLNH
jgi:hypothetical protein